MSNRLHRTPSTAPEHHLNRSQKVILAGTPTAPQLGLQLILALGLGLLPRQLQVGEFFKLSFYFVALSSPQINTSIFLLLLIFLAGSNTVQKKRAPRILNPGKALGAVVHQTVLNSLRLIISGGQMRPSL